MRSGSRTRWGSVGGVVAVLLLHAPVSYADVGDFGSPDDVWTQWTWDPMVLGALLLAGWIHTLGARRLWRSAGRGHGVSVARVAAFHFGLLCLALALVSPLDALGATLFSAHMVQHLVLVALAAPLVVRGKPAVVFAWAVPPEHRGVVRRMFHVPVVRGTIAILSRPVVALARDRPRRLRAVWSRREHAESHDANGRVAGGGRPFGASALRARARADPALGR
jgi:putative membrane protein